MTDETTNTDVTADVAPTPADSNVQISVEQICAAILATVGSVEVSLENLVANYAGKTISVDQNPDTKAVTFALADMPTDASDVLETESESAE
jgi:hypothetical protein